MKKSGAHKNFPEGFGDVTINKVLLNSKNYDCNPLKQVLKSYLMANG